MSSEIPQRWKQCFISSFHRQEPPPSNPGNYRPVNTISVFCRLFEKVLMEHMFVYIYANSIMSPNQHGFSPGRSVQTHFLECVHDWMESQDRRYRDASVFLDVDNTLSHPKLTLTIEICVSSTLLKFYYF